MDLPPPDARSSGVLFDRRRGATDAVSASSACELSGTAPEDRFELSAADDARLFGFESELEKSLTYLPLAVRFKLDRCGVKLLARGVATIARAQAARAPVAAMPWRSRCCELSKDRLRLRDGMRRQKSRRRLRWRSTRPGRMTRSPSNSREQRRRWVFHRRRPLSGAVSRRCSGLHSSSYRATDMSTETSAQPFVSLASSSSRASG